MGLSVRQYMLFTYIMQKGFCFLLCYTKEIIIITGARGKEP